MRSSTIAMVFIVPLIIGAACGSPRVVAGQSPQLGGCPIFPESNVWNTPIDTLPVDHNSTTYVASIGSSTHVHPDFGAGLYEGAPIGIPYVVVPQGQTKVPISFGYASESDPGPYPIPPNPPIEGGPSSTGDRHILVIEQGTCKLYETWSTYPNGDGSWNAGSGAIFDLRSNALRQDTWTSADAAGLPILPGLARYDEIAAGAITHALRFTAPRTRTSYLWPARHQAGSSSSLSLPPMGQRFRLKASVNIAGFSHDTQIILTALKKYGMILADNGSSWYISGTPDDRWNNDQLVGELGQLHGSDFEAVDESSLQIAPNSGQAVPDLKSVSPGGVNQGQSATYRIQIAGDNTAVTVSDPLPAGETFLPGSLSVSAGAPTATYNGGTNTITWSSAARTDIVTISYAVTVDVTETLALVNTATVTHGGTPRTLRATLIANPRQTFLPLTHGG